MTVHATSPLSILIVEDNAADAELALDELAGTGVRLDVAKSGRDALARLANGDGRCVDLVMLDLNLPGGSGLETLEAIKRDPALRRVPVVVLTTSKSTHEIERSYELGAAAVLNKPMRLAEYRSMLGAFRSFWLGHVRLPREAA